MPTFLFEFIDFLSFTNYVIIIGYFNIGININNQISSLFQEILDIFSLLKNNNSPIYPSSNTLGLIIFFVYIDLFHISASIYLTIFSQNLGFSSFVIQDTHYISKSLCKLDSIGFNLFYHYFFDLLPIRWLIFRVKFK